MSLEDIETRRIRADWALRANYHEEASRDFAALVKFARTVKAATLDRHSPYEVADEIIVAALEELENP